MENLAKDLLDAKMCRFLPKHNRNLSNEFRCFVNYPSRLLSCWWADPLLIGCSEQEEQQPGEKRTSQKHLTVETWSESEQWEGLITCWLSNELLKQCKWKDISLICNVVDNTWYFMFSDHLNVFTAFFFYSKMFYILLIANMIWHEGTVWVARKGLNKLTGESFIVLCCVSD